MPSYNTAACQTGIEQQHCYSTVDEMLVGILTLSSNTTVYKHFHLKYNTTSMQCSGF